MGWVLQVESFPGAQGDRSPTPSATRSTLMRLPDGRKPIAGAGVAIIVIIVRPLTVANPALGPASTMAMSDQVKELPGDGTNASVMGCWVECYLRELACSCLRHQPAMIPYLPHRLPSSASVLETSGLFTQHRPHSHLCGTTIR